MSYLVVVPEEVVPDGELELVEELPEVPAELVPADGWLVPEVVPLDPLGVPLEPEPEPEPELDVEPGDPVVPLLDEPDGDPVDEPEEGEDPLEPLVVPL